MAEKTITTRIQLKYDTYTNWASEAAEGKGALLVLKKGEIGLCEIPSGNAQATTAPTILFKVGDGKTAFKSLKWASALAADVYAWAKKANPDIADFGDVIAEARKGLISADSVVKSLNGLKGDLTIGGGADKHISFTAAGSTVTASFAFTDAEKTVLDSGITAAKVSTYDGYATEIAKKYEKPSTGIAKADLAKAVQDSLGKADTALQAHQSVTLASGTNNGTLKLTVGETATDNIAVKGLQALAFKASLAKGDVGLGNVENKTLDTAVTASSGNYITSGAVKTYVDSAIKGVHQFRYEVVAELPTASASTMGKIYLVSHTHSDTQDIYDEFITVESGTASKTYAWEKIGNTDVDLKGYVPTSRTVAGKALSADISAADLRKALNVADGATKVVESTVSGWGFTKNVGTVTGIKMNGAAKTVATDGTVDLGTVITSHQSLAGKQDKLTAGTHITIDADNKISAAWPTASDTGYAGIGKTGTVTSVGVTGDNYISVTGSPVTSSGTIALGLSAKVLTSDDVLIFNCGSSTEVI